MNGTQERVKAGIEKALATKPQSGLRRNELHEAIRDNKAGIEKALGCGHTVTAVAKMMKEAGVTASVETIRARITQVLKQDDTHKDQRVLKTKKQPKPKPKFDTQQDTGVPGFQTMPVDGL